MMLRRSTFLASLAMLALTLAACGRPATPTASGANPGPGASGVQAPAGDAAGLAANANVADATAKVSHAGQALQLHSFSFIPGGTGWAAAADAIYVTHDGGRTWSTLARPGGSVNALDFTSGDTGWVSTDQGLKVSHDGGQTWQAVQTDFTGAADRIDFLSGDAGWVAAGGELERTRDGGRTWEKLTLAAPDFTDRGPAGLFSFVDANTGFTLYGSQPGAGSQAKRLYRTDDGGRTWKLIAQVHIGGGGPAGPGTLPGSGYVGDLFFLDATHGWMGTYRGTLWATADGGITWKGVGLEAEQFVSQADFTTTSSGFADLQVGGGVILLGTEDGGRTWTQRYPAPAPYPFTQAAVSFVDSEHGFGAGTAQDRGAILTTADGGKTWSPVASFAPAAVTALDFTDTQHGWAVTEQSDQHGNLSCTLRRTADGGHTWKTLTTKTDMKELINALSFIDDHTGFTLSGWGHIAVTQDGGATLTAVSDADSRTSSLCFTDVTHGWKVEGGRIYSTADAGHSWTPLALAERVIQVEPLPDGHLWAVAVNTTGGALLLSSSDAGKTWQNWSLGDVTPAAVWFVSPTVGWLADDRGGLYRTADGGQDWTQVR